MHTRWTSNFLKTSKSVGLGCLLVVAPSCSGAPPGNRGIGDPSDQAPTISSQALSASETATPKRRFWERPVNQQAASLLRFKGSAADRLSARRDALNQLRAKHAAFDGLEKGGTPSAPRRVLQASFDSHGRISGLWAFFAEGLARKEKDPEDAVKRFILAEKSLFNLADSDASAPDDLDWLHLDSKAVSVIDGKNLTVARFQQDYRELSIKGGDLNAVFVDDVLVSLVGTVVNPAEAITTGTIAIGESDAGNAAAFALLGKTGKEHSVKVEPAALNLGQERVQYSVRARAVPSMSSAQIGVEHRVIVDATTGAIFDIAEDSQNGSVSTGTYKVYRPISTDQSPSQKRVLNATAPVWIEGTTVFPWVMSLNAPPERWAIPTFSGANVIANQQQPFTTTLPNKNFLALENTAQFAEQHTLYWMNTVRSHALPMFSLFPPTELAQGTPLRVVSQPLIGPTTFDAFPRYLPGGCSFATAPDSWDVYPCIHLGENLNGGYQDAKTPQIANIFHEYGHYADSIYGWVGSNVGNRSNPTGPTCEGGTAEEGRSVGESIAGIHSLAMFASVFGLETGFSDYDAVGGSLWYLDSTGEHVHQNNDRILSCYDTSAPCGTGAGDISSYDFGKAVRQAFWESIFGLNCFVAAGQPCVAVNNGTNKILDAKKAVFYAMQTTVPSATQTTLVANLLTYYYFYAGPVGNPAWNDRWWIFNHHNLVGGRFGYSPCHQFPNGL